MLHAYLYTKHLEGITLSGEIVIHHRKWRDVIIFAYLQSLSTNNIWQTYKGLTEHYYGISHFIPTNSTQDDLIMANYKCCKLFWYIQVYIVADGNTKTNVLLK